jgi:hypothetical protein
VNQTEIRLSFGHSSKPILEALRRYQSDKFHRSLAEAARHLLKETLERHGYAIVQTELLPSDVEPCDHCNKLVRGEKVFDGHFRKFRCLCGSQWFKPVDQPE